ncbi:hypothetical protein AYJ54_24670 [Bradyrhizobium centrolobii]|uniref:Uncharacterized protein n=2 Tax=Bradyrhizobium TaxID=374 RepID=A0A176Z0E6_9BRAD|nr:MULTISPECIES: hypothetical protein [Bradyrhizobium]OAF03742.1 hypothetical protein AYJ54_24670 [Bradyrhizobium centrolobii]OAF12501.1 hypothetical protein AXW67_20030 [Bradyrhizobium neotropicale]
MTKMPQHAVGPGTSLHRFDIDDSVPAIEPSVRRVNNMEVDGAHANGGKTKASTWWDTHTQDLRDGAAIEAVPEVPRIEAVTRVGLNETRAGTNEIDRAQLASPLYGDNLARGLLSFVTPHLRHPEVLCAEKHGVLLERLADVLSAATEGTVAREGIVVLQQELGWLIQLRQNRNSLIKG